MNYMFQDVKSFKETLRGAAWASSKASTVDMFEGSYGSISPTEVSKPEVIKAISSQVEFKSAVDARLKLSVKGDCSDGPNGAIGECDVSGVDDIAAHSLIQIHLTPTSLSGTCRAEEYAWHVLGHVLECNII